ncbi:MAG: hypothetical protein ACRDRJ_07460 [Streptosporangiaceae bacterium]
MPYFGCDDAPGCDLCGKEDYFEMYIPWPFRDAWHRLESRPQKDLFLICGDCARKAILLYAEIVAGGEARRQAIFNSRRWEEWQKVREEAERAREARLNDDPSYQRHLLLMETIRVVDEAAREISGEQADQAPASD